MVGRILGRLAGGAGAVLTSLVAIAALTPSFATAQEFDLVCKGNQITNEQGASSFPKSGPFQAFVIRYRVSIDRGRWCAEGCTSTSPLVRVTATELKLESVSADELGMDRATNVNRESGEYLHVERYMLGPGLTWRQGSNSIVRMGTCERATFSGFPTPKF